MVEFLDLLAQFLKRVTLEDPAALEFGLVILAPTVPRTDLVRQIGGEVAALEGIALTRGHLAGVEAALVEDAPRRNAIVVVDGVVEMQQRVPAVVRRSHGVLVHIALAQAVHVEVAETGHGVQDGEIVLGIARPHGVHGNDHVHMPQLRAHVLHHLDAVTRVVLPAFELEGVALQVLVFQLLVELEAAARHNDAFAGLHRLLLAADGGVRADDLLRVRILDKALVMAVEQNLHAQLFALGVQLVERQHAEAVHARQLAGALVGVVVEEVVLGDGAGQRHLGHLVGHAVLVGVLGVARALVDPRFDHGIRRLAVRERLDVLLEALLLVLFDDGPLAVVDAAVAATLDWGLLKHENFLAALVGADERGPHARAAIADDQKVALVVPVRGHPIARCGARLARRAAGQRARTRHGGRRNARALQERTTRDSAFPTCAHDIPSSFFGWTGDRLEAATPALMRKRPPRRRPSA